MLVIDPFAGSCNTLFWILLNLPNAEGLAFESDPQVYELTRRNLASLGQKIDLVHGDYVKLLEHYPISEDRAVVAFVGPPWGAALDEVQGLDLRRTTPPIIDVIQHIARQFSKHNILFAIQVYENVNADSLAQLQKELDWSDLRVYDINDEGRNHGILLGTKGWSPLASSTAAV
jgi:RNA cap guanine-N2 methyltransferase